MKKILQFVAITILSLGQTLPVMAAVNHDLKAAINDTVLYDAKDYSTQCAGQSSTSSNGPATVAGHTLPATHGGAGFEESINAQGQVPSTGQQVSFWQNAKLGQNFRDYYITMRWRYSLWNWDGTSGGKGSEDVTFYSQAPRVLVTDPKTGKSIIAVVMEAGPAPWTGVDSNGNNTPKQGWANPQDGTPAAYKGRVSGFPPVAAKYLGYSQRMQDGSGDDLLYSWAPDQNAQPGPYAGSVTSSTTTTFGVCSPLPTAGSGSIVATADAEFAKDVTVNTTVNGKPKQTITTPDAQIKIYTGGIDEEWCADFVSWVYKTAGTPFKPVKIGYVPTMISFFQNLGPTHFFPNRPTPSSTPPQPGDAIFFNWSGASTVDPNNGDHVGIVETVNPTTGAITTIEGNAGNPGAIRRENYNYKTDSVVLGWGRM